MWSKILICLNDNRLTETFEPVLQKETIENTASTFVFSVAMTIVKKVLVLENQLYKKAPEITINGKLYVNEQEIIHDVSGYYALIKRYKRSDENGNIEAKDATHEVDAYNFFYFVKKWASLVDWWTYQSE